MRKTQLIAAVLATACAGVGTTALACGSCHSGLAPVGEYVTTSYSRPFCNTRTFIRERPLCYTGYSGYTGLAPVGELVTTRRVIVRRVIPVRQRIIVRRACVTNLEPVGEITTTRRVLVERSAPFGETFARTVTTPVRWVGNVVTWPARRAFYRSRRPAIIGERVVVTRVRTYPSGRTFAKRSHRKIHHVMRSSELRRGGRHVVFTKRIAPVGERVTIRHFRHR